ncbi:hypothetical protein CAPTEDRAFT_190539 [Capitella teleta]|uniref:Endonuclease/exonuclease/phosphatase domain-containing protein n=1 Tax=Capitella teleta TaxID=283909 RepID=R7TGF3_CAPTE|nr:hypothetical protein CAPTEDRAFT_190539 [Capitella teleta]|eukprot:ELT92853.1 hypothetical protein CAPTEDRAFT_190539 [Capitella teleta]
MRTYTSRYLIDVLGSLPGSMKRVTGSVYWTLKDLDILKKTHRGVSAGQFQQRRIQVIVSARNGLRLMGHSLSSVNNNIVVERRFYESDSVVCENSGQDRGTRMCLVNAQSVCNKALQLHDLVLDNDLDLCVITETWLKGDARDNTIVAELTPPGFKLVHRPRQGRGGGVAIIHTCQRLL